MQALELPLVSHFGICELSFFQHYLDHMLYHSPSYLTV
jgi:hypothetical protein